MRKIFGKIVLYLFIGVFFFSVFSSKVEAIGMNNVIGDEVLNKYSDTIKFVNDSIAIVKGSLRNRLFVVDVLNQIKVREMTNEYDEYNISRVAILDGDGNELVDGSIVTSGMNLLFYDINDSVLATYDIVVVGDVYDGDDVDDYGIVNNGDINSMVDSILNNELVNFSNDVNGDLIFDIHDVTYTIYSVTNGCWFNDSIVSDNLVSNFTSPSDIYVGDEIEVIYSLSGFSKDSINGIEGVLNYDHNLLELVSVNIDSEYGDINSDNKFIYILDNYSGSDALLTLKFRVLKEGNSVISINGIKASMNGLAVNIDNNTVSTSIKINNYGIGGDEPINNNGSSNNSNNDVIYEYPKEEVNKSDNTSSNNLVFASNRVDSTSSNSISYISLSNDNYIKELIIKDYEIDFNKDILEYSITVGSDVDSLELNILLSDDNASYEVIGNEKFKTGKNVVSIVVTSEDGSERTYTINVNKKKASDKKESDSNSSRVVIIILIILIIIGLIYVIFKDDEEEERENNKKDSKE